MSPGRAERHAFEYYRHGTLSLFAALNTQSGEVLGQTVPRHTSAAFVDFLGDIVASQPKRREIHVIAETNLNDPRLVRPQTAGGLGLDAQWREARRAFRAAGPAAG